jgi:hypothetical protein
MVAGFFNRKEQEQERQKEGRLPPGQALTNKFPVLHYGPVPDFILPPGISASGVRLKMNYAGHGASSTVYPAPR